MQKHNWRTASFALSLALALVVPAMAAKTVSTQKVGGKLRAVAENGEETGKFVFETAVKGEKIRESMAVTAEGLDTTTDDAGDLPVYDIWLITDDGGTEADFGDMKLRRSGKAKFKFRSRRDDYPAAIDEVRDFTGGKVEIRDADDGVVLRGNIPDYLGLDDDNEEGSHSRVKAAGSRNLSPDDDESRAVGKIGTKYQNKPGGADEQLLLVCKRLETGSHTLVAIDGENVETEVGTFRAISRAGVGVLRLDSRQGTEIPGGVLDLGGQKLEVRDGDENVVLKGRFPDLLPE